MPMNVHFFGTLWTFLINQTVFLALFTVFIPPRFLFNLKDVRKCTKVNYEAITHRTQEIRGEHYKFLYYKANWKCSKFKLTTPFKNTKLK